MTTDGRLAPADLAIDRELADIALSYRFLLDLTPVDLAEARRRFLDDGTAPEFTYRPLEDDVSVVASRLGQADTTAVEDPTLAHLVQAKEREIALQLEMLRCRGSSDFLPLSLELYGAVTPSLLAAARRLLEEIDQRSVGDPHHGRHGHRGNGDGDGEQALDAATFAQRVEAEIERYRATLPGLDVRVEVRDDGTGVMFVDGEVLIASTTRVPTARVDALLQHEVGTHAVTYVNGTRQPLRLLAAGLAGHDETQEGLAVLAEHLVGGLTATRLRQLAARVLAVHQMVEGAGFADVHRVVVDAGLAPGPAFTVVARVFRSGGLTKDAVYLRGLLDILHHLGTGGDLDALWLGKMALADAPLVEELRARRVLREPALRPRYLDDPLALARLCQAGGLASPADLIGGPA